MIFKMLTSGQSWCNHSTPKAKHLHTLAFLISSVVGEWIKVTWLCDTISQTLVTWLQNECVWCRYCVPLLWFMFMEYFYEIFLDVGKILTRTEKGSDLLVKMLSADRNISSKIVKFWHRFRWSPLIYWIRLLCNRKLACPWFVSTYDRV